MATTAMGDRHRRQAVEDSIITSVEAGPVATIEHDLYVLDRIEVEARTVPDPEHEVSIERTPLELEPRIALYELLVGRREGVGDVSLDAEPTRVLDLTGEEVRLEVLALEVANEVGA